MTLEQERKALAEQRRKLERDRQEFARRVEIEDRRLEQERRLFDMKVKILEEELKKLASEKQYIEKQREFYSRVNEFEQTNYGNFDNGNSYSADNVIKGEMFFTGVGSKQSVKKRYRDLIKIYHPDNLDGDTEVIQEINSEYNKLCAIYNI